MGSRAHALVWALFLAVAAGVASVAYSAETEVYAVDTTTAAYRTGLDGGDLAAIDSSGLAASATIQRATGAPTIAVSARFSAASATCLLTFVRGYEDPDGAFTEHGVQTATATATASTVGGDYVANDVYFDTGGSPHFRVLAADPSSGTVDLWYTKTSQ